MTILSTSLNQMAVLFSFIIIGFVLVKTKVLTTSSSSILAKLENNVFVPCLVLGTFASNFTVDKLGAAWKLFMAGFAVTFIMMPIAILLAKMFTKDSFMRNIYTYGLTFSNFGFMGNAVVAAVFPDIFLEYLIFTLPMYIMIYVWAVPNLLIPSNAGKGSLRSKLKALVNPMFIFMLIGMVMGLLSMKLPSWADSVVTISGNCMSPLAMILTGITVAETNLKKIASDWTIYAASLIRLVIFPLIYIGIFFVLPFRDLTFIACTVSFMAMPLGLNTVVIPSAYGKDTSVAAGMAIISHLMSCATIPIIFSLMTNLFY